VAIKFGETVRIGYVYNLAILIFGEFRIALPHACVHHTLRDSWILYIIGDRLFNRQIAKLKPPPKFPVIRYVEKCEISEGLGGILVVR